MIGEHFDGFTDFDSDKERGAFANGYVTGANEYGGDDAGTFEWPEDTEFEEYYPEAFQAAKEKEKAMEAEGS